MKDLWAFVVLTALFVGIVLVQYRIIGRLDARLRAVEAVASQDGTVTRTEKGWDVCVADASDQSDRSNRSEASR